MIREEIIPLLARHLQPKVYLELGIGYAGPTNFCKVIEVLPYSQVWGVDTVDMKDRFPGTNVFTGTTEEFEQFWEDNYDDYIDMIFVDADHSAEAVLRDVEGYFRFLTPDTGVMILHDTWPVAEDWTGPEKSGDAYRVPRQLKERYGNTMEVFTLPFYHGLTFIRRVGDNWRNG
jgi:hypothetical protein